MKGKKNQRVVMKEKISCFIPGAFVFIIMQIDQKAYAYRTLLFLNPEDNPRFA